MRRVSILGSTGSIGESALDVVRASGGQLGIAALAAGSNWRRLAAQAREFRPLLVTAADADAARELGRELAGSGIRVAAGAEGLEEAATLAEADVVLSAIVGAAGILPTLAAARAGKTIALANKESLVAAGGLITAAVRGCRRGPAAGGQRAQRAFSAAGRPRRRRGEPSRADRLGRAVFPPRRAVSTTSPRRTRCATRAGAWAPRSPSTRRR